VADQPFVVFQPFKISDAFSFSDFVVGKMKISMSAGFFNMDS